MPDYSDDINSLAGSLLDLLPSEERLNPGLFLSASFLHHLANKKFARRELMSVLTEMGSRSSEIRVSQIEELIFCARKIRSRHGLQLLHDTALSVYKAADRAFGTIHPWRTSIGSYLDTKLSSITLRHALVVYTTLKYCISNVSDPSARAAQDLNLSEQEVSRMFSSVELKLKVKLRERTGKGPRRGVTKIGVDMYPAFLDIARGATTLAFYEREISASDPQ